MNEVTTGGSGSDPVCSAARVATLTLPVQVSSARLAREFVQSVLGPPDDYRAALVTSELVTNAIRHTRTEIHLRVEADGHSVRIEVRDDGDGTPEPKAMSATGTSGRGLALVEAVSQEWGVTPQPVGKIVWALVRRHHAP